MGEDIHEGTALDKVSREDCDDNQGDDNATIGDGDEILPVVSQSSPELMGVRDLFT